LDFHVFGKLKDISEARRFPSDDTVKSEVQKRLQQKDVSFYLQGLEDLIVRYEKCLNKFGKTDDLRPKRSVSFSSLHLPPFA
jgi:hypothetical protein